MDAPARPGTIVYFHRTRSRDGQAVHIAGMTSALRRLGWTVRMVEPSGASDAPFGGDAGGVARAKRLLPKVVYELLECGYQLVEIVRLIRALRRGDVDAIYQRANLYMLSAAIAARWFRTPLLVEVNAPIALERGAEPGLGWPGLARWSEQALWRSADHTLPVTQVLADRIAETGVPRSRVTVVPNGIDVDEFPPGSDREAAKRRLGLEGRIVIGFVGFVRAWHRGERLVDFLADGDREGNCHAILVGDGPSREGLLSYARKRGVADRFTITGVIRKADIPDHVAAFDIAVLPDVVPYACPLKLIEYLAAGRAILAPDRANIRELIDPDVDGVLFDPADDKDFAGALSRLVKDADLRGRLERGARRTFEHRSLLWDTHAATVGRIIASVQGKPTIS